MTDHVIISDFIKRCANNFFQRVDDNDDFKGRTVTCRRWI